MFGARKSSAYLALPVTFPWMSGGMKFLPNNMCSSAMVEPSVALREELRIAAHRDHAALRDSFDRLRPGQRAPERGSDSIAPVRTLQDRPFERRDRARRAQTHT